MTAKEALEAAYSRMAAYWAKATCEFERLEELRKIQKAEVKQLLEVIRYVNVHFAKQVEMLSERVRKIEDLTGK